MLKIQKRFPPALAVILVLTAMQSAPAQTAPPNAGAAAEQPSAVLPGRPDADAASGNDGELLGGMFESAVAGIRFRAPGNCKEIRRAGGDEIVQYANETHRWVLKVNRLAFSQPIAMTYHKDNKGRDVNGLLEESIDRLKTEYAGIEIYRQDITHNGKVDVGMIAGKCNIGADANLIMVALVRQTPVDASIDGALLYYTFNFTAVVPRGVDLEKDPKAAQAVSRFTQVVDSVEVLDQTALRQDQDERLYRTRALYVNLTESRLRKTLAPEQWLRLIRDGKDIGYSYIVEDTGRDLPRAGERRGAAQSAGGPEGVLIGVRSRSTPESGVRVDAESWLWSSFDRKHEKWSNIAVINNPTTGKEAVGDVGSSDAEIRIVKEDDLLPGEQIRRRDGKIDVDKNQPPVRQQEFLTLNVTRIGKGKRADPMTWALPPFYLPQALGHLLPRLVARQQPTGYLFRVYNSDTQQVVMRYVDVDPETTVKLDGKQVRAIPVRDKLGMEGSVTIHYISPAGAYLGSINSDSKIMILPSDAATLTKMWKDADLSRPGNVEEK